MKSAYTYLREAMRQKRDTKEWRELLTRWRKSRVVVRTAKPFRLDQARRLGLKAKKGFTIARVRLRRGGHKKTRPRGGRRSKRMTIKKSLKMNYRWIAESRAARKFPNLEVLNSYKLAQDGRNYFFEIILVDPKIPEIRKDKNLKWLGSKKNKRRVFRGLTSAGRKSRGLRNKGNRAIKVRPSVRSGGRKGK
ncbi:MAG: 50S ribosomal protein L15e [archaeon]|nr:MAG: 50S ribosomal protein L15e [archaeon]